MLYSIFETAVVVLIVAAAAFFVYRSFFVKKSTGCGCGSNSCSTGKNLQTSLEDHRS